MQKQNRKAKNIKPGMYCEGKNGRPTEVVEVRGPHAKHDGIIIVTRDDLFRYGGGRHFAQHGTVPVLRGL